VPPYTVDVTVRVRPLEEKMWTNCLRQSRRSEASDTARKLRKLEAQPEI
jgi:hypothetical protein